MSSTTPLRLDAALVNEARASASLFDRSPTAQIEFWAKLGRVAEAVLSHDSIKTLKATERVQDLTTLLSRADTPAGQKRAKAVIMRHGSPVYGSDSAFPGDIIETMPDGSKRRGKFVNRRFMAIST